MEELRRLGFWPKAGELVRRGGELGGSIAWFPMVVVYQNDNLRMVTGTTIWAQRHVCFVVQPATSVDWNLRTTSLGLPFRTLFCILQDRPSALLLRLFVEDKVWHGHPPLLPGTRSDCGVSNLCICVSLISSL